MDAARPAGAAPRGAAYAPSSPTAIAIWERFCERFRISDHCVPLFELDGIHVATRKIGRDQRPLLSRSEAMERLVIEESGKLVADWRAGARRFDGLIYAMGYLRDERFEPLYIGKAETLGKGSGNLSANLANLDKDRSKFARWGDNHAYHIGDLSACVLPGNPEGKQTRKYMDWARTLFIDVPAERPRLREPVHFWAQAWDRAETGVWPELGPTRLASLEYLLIGVAGLAFPMLLNREGIGR